MRLVSLDKPNKYHLIFNLDPRVFFGVLKCGWTAFEIARKCYLIIFSFYDVILCYLNQKVKPYVSHMTGNN